MVKQLPRVEVVWLDSTFVERSDKPLREPLAQVRTVGYLLSSPKAEIVRLCMSLFSHSHDSQSDSQAERQEILLIPRANVKSIMRLGTKGDN